MSAHDPRRAERVFLAIADLPRERWAEELEARCNGDTTLAGEVRSLLDCHEEAGDFLDARELHAGSLPFNALRDDTIDELIPGTRFGEFLIERPLGRGGMGRVFVATQDRPKRSVALKVIRRGLATPSLLRRFEHEAEVLGRLHHPGIAQIFEAGAARTSGPDGAVRAEEIPRPYIAMELINGPPLNVYADAHRLDTRARLELMAKVCDAVHHAHQRGVIHRDLKPANILIDETGQPKILDFGVARAADADLRVTTLQTNVGQLIGTLPYMSPEQVLADPAEVDTRSDVYALGVNLYELLTGRLPLDLKSRSIPEAARVIKEEAPTKLSHVSRVFRGEVDTIVSKAMDKDKARRYQSAGDLADDLRRHLRGEAIHARQDSALYVIRTQLRRYRWAVSAAAVFLVGLLAFAVYAGWSAQNERRLAFDAQIARRDAEREKAITETLNSRLASELTYSNIERGRLEGAVGNLPLAEDVLWSEYFKDPASSAAYWGLWELYSRVPVLWTAAGERTISCAAISADAARIVTGTRNGSVVLFHGRNGQRYRTIDRLGGSVTHVVLTPDGETAVVVIDTGAILLLPLNAPDAPVPLTRVPLGAGEVRAVALSPDGHTLAVGGAARTISLWDLRTRSLASTWAAHPEAVSALAFNSDGSRLASAGRQIATGSDAVVWDVATGTRLLDLERDRAGYTSGLLFAGRYLLATSNEGSAAWFDLDSREAIPLRGEFVYGASGTASLSPDGSAVFAGALESLYSVGQTTPFRRLGSSRYRTIASGWIDATTLLMVHSNGSIRAVDVRKEMAARRYTGFRSWCHSVAFSPDGATVAAGGGDGTIAIIDRTSLEARAVVRAGGSTFRTRALAFLRDSRTLLAGGMDGAVRFIDAADGSVLHTCRRARAEVFAIAVDPQERWFVSGHGDGIIRVWSLETRDLVTELARTSSRGVSLTFAPDGTSLVSPFNENAAAVWDTATWTLRTRLETANSAWGSAFSPDGRTLLLSTYGGTVEVFDWPSMARRAVLLAHPRLVPALAYSPDGRYFATGSEHGNAKLWDAATLRPLATFEPEAIQVTAVSFDPSSSVLALGCAARFAAFYDLHAMDDCIEGNAEYQRQRLPRN